MHGSYLLPPGFDPNDFVRGLSVRDVEATLAEALGDQAAISKSTVSSVCQAIKGEYEAWALRRLEEITLDYVSSLHSDRKRCSCLQPGCRGTINKT